MMAFRAGDVIGLIWSHPIVSVVVLLLFTPPLFPILVYFSPLLISTALFVLAMVSMGSDETTSSSYMRSSGGGMGMGMGMGGDVVYKRGWIEDIAVDEDGPELVDGERVSKRLKSSSSTSAKDEDSGWLGRVKNWEGTGRAWVESVLTQESRKVVADGDDGGTVVTREAPRVTETDAKEEFFAEEKSPSPPLREAEDGSGASKAVASQTREDDPPKEEQKRNDSPADDSGSANAVKDASEGIDEVAGKSNTGVVRNASRSEIGPAADTEGEDPLSTSVPASPLFRPRSGAPKVGAAAAAAAIASGTVARPIAGDAKEKSNQLTEAAGALEGGSDSGENCKNTQSGPASNSKANDQEDRNVAQLSAAGKDRSKETDDDGRTSRAAPEIVPASDDEGATVEAKHAIPKLRSHEVQIDKAHTNGGTATDKSGGDGRGAGQPKVKSAAELLAPLRHGQQDTPSAAVALSEKLKVPLADIMSLLAGDDKDTVPNEGPSAVKVSTSSETTTTQEGEWSSSDDDVLEPEIPEGGSSVEKKQG